MGHMWPIRGKEKREGSPLGVEPWAPRPPRVAGHVSPLFLVGLVPHGKGREGAPPLSTI